MNWFQGNAIKMVLLQTKSIHLSFSNHKGQVDEKDQATGHLVFILI